MFDGAVSHGFGLKMPDQYRLTMHFEAEPDTAYAHAMKIAKAIADDALSNPDTGKTVVELVSLQGPQGSMDFDRKKAIAETSMPEHILALGSEKK